MSNNKHYKVVDFQSKEHELICKLGELLEWTASNISSDHLNSLVRNQVTEIKNATYAGG